MAKTERAYAKQPISIDPYYSCCAHLVLSPDHNECSEADWEFAAAAFFALMTFKSFWACFASDSGSTASHVPVTISSVFGYGNDKLPVQMSFANSLCNIDQTLIYENQSRYSPA